MRQPSELGLFLRDQIERRHGGSVRAAALYIGVAHTTLRDIMLGASVPTKDTARKIAAWSRLPETYILRLAGYLGSTSQRDLDLEARAERERMRQEFAELGEVMEQQATVEKDVIGTAPAGYPQVEEQQTIGGLRIPAGSLVIRIQGDSLIDLRIEPGDLIVVDPTNKEPRPGQLVVVRVLTTNEITVKRFFQDDKCVRLEPANHRYQCIRTTEVEIIGVVVFSLRKPKRLGG